MKKDLKYFETEIKRITEEFEDYKKKHMGTPKPGKWLKFPVWNG